ncbi:MAG: hypothetical protein HYY09_01980, partial [Firmicutes bacterium]|nr:hypothetical protein [Bacillota bacterium]
MVSPAFVTRQGASRPLRIKEHRPEVRKIVTGLTPMFQQYLRIKEQHPDSVLFFRNGDFYEMFFEDAEVGARDLD